MIEQGRSRQGPLTRAATAVTTGAIVLALLPAVGGATAAEFGGASEPQVERLAGADRYETAVAVSAETFPDGSDTVFVATGENYPDALAAGPAAALEEGPILLTRSDRLPDATIAELERLEPTDIRILGGETAVSVSVAEQLDTFTAGSVERWAGPDRYATAAAVSTESFPDGADTVFVATGENYPDALAGGPAAALAEGPILLTRTMTLPDATITELERLAPTDIYTLGGPAAVSASIRDQLADYATGIVDYRAGADRYGTAAAISDSTFPDGADTVFVATGRDYPDALAGGPAAARAEAPILLTDPVGLPYATITELQRLAPSNITILGGTTAVGDNLADDIADALKVAIISPTTQINVEQGAEVEVVFETSQQRNYELAISPGRDAATGFDGPLDATFVEDARAAVTEVTATLHIPEDTLVGVHDLRVLAYPPTGPPGRAIAEGIINVTDSGTGDPTGPGEVGAGALSAGTRHTCGLRSDGAPVCWGDDEHGQSSPPDGLALTTITAGNWHTCGLEVDGTPVCWGSDSSGQSSPPDGLTLVAISAGHFYTCGVEDDGAPVCWGDEFEDHTLPPDGLSLKAIGAAALHTCGLEQDGSAVCWGRGSRGESSPPAGSQFSTISLGNAHSCGLKDDGTPICWGDDWEGQASPPAGLRLLSISAGSTHTCAVKTDGAPVCWGERDRGQSLPPNGLALTTVSAGYWHTCGLEVDGTPVCWGSDSYGQSSPPDGLRLGR